ncbi:PREDICTED: uncharacterized protein LOC109207519 [Nicotiana attenuata]|uniref:uncharacterized protein LOC109207519 n=1 Tax=Nicotiana attenuata TaxID=49451 RepID=UPI0009052663|nr:PREDICTED: uncharacterized protein LOC109207519 [Nicotiana attenuata]
MGFTKSCYTHSPMQAELLALQEGLKLAIELPFPDLQIETDSTEVLRMLDEDYSTTNPCLLTCRSLTQQLKSLVIRHSFREGNAVADCLAKEAVRNFKPGLCYRLARPPTFVEPFLEKDMQDVCLGVKKLNSTTCNSLVSLNNSNVLRDNVTPM